MTEQEAHALTSILQRVPMTAAEVLWAQALIQRLIVKPPAAPPGVEET